MFPAEIAATQNVIDLFLLTCHYSIYYETGFLFAGITKIFPLHDPNIKRLLIAYLDYEQAFLIIRFILKIIKNIS